jgi:phage shock protein PspC (stress-responsive transcriptional regulator)
MNKTVNINLGGLAFIIDEAAYDKLSAYLQSLVRHFAATEGHEEIMQDIEARVAEILKMKLGNSKQIVTMADIDEVISIIGKPEEMGGEGAENADNTAKAPYPPTQEFFRRRLYRDKDNATLGGVCAGLGSYFDIDPVWIRLIWAVSFFVFGIGFFLYLIMWFVIPEAKTPAQKLEMRGDQYDLDSIKRSFKEEGERFGKRVEDWANDFSSKESKRRFKRAGRDIADSISPAARRAGNIISKTVLSVLLFIVGVIFVIVAVAFFSNTSSIHLGDSLPFDTSAWDMASMFTESTGETNLLMVGVGLVVLTPLFMLLYGITRAIIGYRKKLRVIGIASSVLWWAGVLVCGLETYRIYQRLDEKEKAVEIVDITQPKGDTLMLDSRIPAAGISMTEIEFGNDTEYLASENPMTLWPQARINIQPSDNGKFYIKLERMARGKNGAEALTTASGIHLNYEVKDSSKLVIDRYATLPPEAKFRGQRITVIVAVPEGKYIAIGSSLRNILIGSPNIQDVDPYNMAGNVWKMESAGLSCINCTNKKPKHRHDDADEDEDF